MSEPIHPALKRFIWDIQSMVELTDDPREILLIGADLMGRLVATDDWLPEAFAEAGAEGPRQYQLFGDGAERFCVVASVLGPGQTLPLLLEPFWQILGVVRGTVRSETVAASDGATARALDTGRVLGPGAVARHAPKAGEALRLSNTAAGTAIVLHVHGGEIGGRARHDLKPDGRLETRAFGYANGPEHPAYDIWSIQAVIED